ncbi:hypothetical protein PanWU01x14_024070 [Parasponia andersonii]|uniref:Uncharacterized protein n=1 Tax=Parasponia andersonii TaxID=3476 RepID=A0A2P5DXP4_PARAD|nr:hypothetical protein PanWU01x14_024070 [Parasponia andersonii]
MEARESCRLEFRKSTFKKARTVAWGKMVIRTNLIYRKSPFSEANDSNIYLGTLPLAVLDLIQAKSLKQ